MVSEDGRITGRVPTRLDRYPAKMVTHLAERLVSKYATGCTNLLDPFCGSGAILAAGARHGFHVTGFDVNPYATLLASVKLNGFDPDDARRLHKEVVGLAQICHRGLPISWDSKEYWFSPETIDKYERIRYAAKAIGLNRSRSGKAVLLALALSVRLCSRADQRSPKPFISKRAKRERVGRHFDPYRCTDTLLEELSLRYGGKKANASARVLRVDLAEATASPDVRGG